MNAHTSGTCVPRLIQQAEGAFEAGVTCNSEVTLERKWGCHTLRCVYQGPPGSLRRPDLDTRRGSSRPQDCECCVCVCDVCLCGACFLCVVGVVCVCYVCLACDVLGVICVSVCACSSEAPGGPRRPQAASAGPGELQEAPRRGLGYQKVQKAPGGPRRFQEAPRRLRGGVWGSSL